MKNKRDSLILIVIVAAALWAAFVFFKPRDSAVVADSEIAPSEGTIPASTALEPQPTVREAKSATPVTGPSDGEVKFGLRLKEIGDCLKIGNTLNESAQPQLSELQGSLQSSLGDFINTTLEWKNVHLTMPSGEKRRLRLEVDVDAEQSLSRRLQYYSVDSEGMTVPIPLSPEQETNPTETFISGLESDGQVTMQEEAHRGFYPQGVELYYVERNGFLSEIEMNYQGKSVRCQDLEKPNSGCRCF
ncbi:MAG: hypothetical protein H7326_06420 [Bdellovibrionaceae bacterium]|nr:hypothetical protein [Pseudobdellovibrionaceae bacterium]